MDLKEAMYMRRAVREFTGDPVDEKILRQLIDAAVQVPSAVNQQPWSFCVVRDHAVLDRISREAKAHMLRTSPAALSHHFQDILSDPKFHILYHAPRSCRNPIRQERAGRTCETSSHSVFLLCRHGCNGACPFNERPSARRVGLEPSGRMPAIDRLLGFSLGRRALPRPRHAWRDHRAAIWHGRDGCTKRAGAPADAGRSLD